MLGLEAQAGNVADGLCWPQATVWILEGSSRGAQFTSVSCASMLGRLLTNTG